MLSRDAILSLTEACAKKTALAAFEKLLSSTTLQKISNCRRSKSIDGFLMDFFLIESFPLM